ncbi:hypothetical protein MN116_007246 [Schistosoma mekongi]|uniref:C2H2-type domain-containing protein n=1 Tax=Schistosoma mekongi TaxID=38744 RepID=A0AAE2D3E4_SCHME|nr:hypothetical protein MN116_007246 [Schistosoma mekongi]
MGLLPLLDASDVLVLHCPLCYFHTHWLNHLETHFNHEHSSENVDFMLYQCSKCRKIASCKTFLYEHIDIRHKRTGKSTSLQSPRTQSPNDTLSDHESVSITQRNSETIELCSNNTDPSSTLIETPDSTGIINNNCTIIPNDDEKQSASILNTDENESTNKDDFNVNHKSDINEFTNQNTTNNDNSNNNSNGKDEDTDLNNTKNCHSPYIKILFVGQLCGSSSILTSATSSTTVAAISSPTSQTLPPTSLSETLTKSKHHQSQHRPYYHAQKFPNYNYNSNSTVKQQCLFCDYTSSDSTKLAEHYVQHGIRQLQLPNMHKLKKLHRNNTAVLGNNYLPANPLDTVDDLTTLVVPSSSSSSSSLPHHYHQHNNQHETSRIEINSQVKIVEQTKHEKEKKTKIDLFRKP